MRILSSFLIVLLLIVCAAPDALAQGSSGGAGGNQNGRTSTERDSDAGSRNPTRRVIVPPPPPRVIVVPVPPRQTGRVPTRPKVTRLPGDPVVPLTDAQRTDMTRHLGVPEFAVTGEGRPEHIAVGPTAETELAAAALTDAGALILRRRAYPNLDRSALIVDLQDLTLAQARAVLAAVAPGTLIDLHALYGYAKGPPRLYAAALVARPDSPACVLLPGIRIGQIDGPVETDHPALRDAGVVSHAVPDAPGAALAKDHGTAVAALLVGQDADGALAGFAAGAQLFAANAFARTGAAEASDVERIGAALDWLAGHRVQLVNMSFAGPVNAALADLLDAMAGQGVILIAAAGNGGRAQAVYPAAAPSVIGVTAIDAAQRLYRMANTGPYVEFAAPGVDLYVARHDGGGYVSGTSYASPILTGLASRLAARGVTSADEMRARLRAQSVDLGESGRDDAFGWGLVKDPGC